jgi:hypothetical protein
MKMVTIVQRRIAQDYASVKPKQLGNLHERMKFVMKALEEARGWKTSEPDPEFDEMYHDLVHGLFDLENEVKFYRPEQPAIAARGWKIKRAKTKRR